MNNDSKEILMEDWESAEQFLCLDVDDRFCYKRELRITNEQYRDVTMYFYNLKTEHPVKLSEQISSFDYLLIDDQIHLSNEKILLKITDQTTLSDFNHSFFYETYEKNNTLPTACHTGFKLNDEKEITHKCLGIYPPPIYYITKSEITEPIYTRFSNDYTILEISSHLDFQSVAKFNRPGKNNQTEE